MNRTSQETTISNWQDKITKVSDDFYVAKIPGKDLWMVMEHVNSPGKQDQWLSYIRVQNNSRAVEFAANAYDKNFSISGSGHFKRVMEDVDISKNDVWVAYITSNSQPQSILETNDLRNYSVEHATQKGSSLPFPANIKLYVTITSSPNALITSHMGVSKSLEGLRDENLKSISMDLHSFGAKVMKMLNPARKFMINAPVIGMEMIMAKAMPKGTIFVGTKQMKEKLAKIQNATYDDFLKENPNLYTEKENRIKKSFDLQIKNELENKAYALQYFQKGRITEEKYQQDIKEYDDQIKKAQDSINTKTLKSYDGITTSWDDEIKKRLKKEFSYWKTPYTFSGGWKGFETIGKIMDAYGPPLLSVDTPEGKSFQNTLTVFDKDNPEQVWLTIKKGNLDYDWLFTYPFKPAGDTHFIVVDLDALANLKPLE